MGACLSLKNQLRGDKKELKIGNQQINNKEEIVINKQMFISKNQGKFKDNYQIGNTLGQGAFGEVRKCIHRTTKVIRAVKLIRKDSMTPEEEQAF